jgi:hypothetical protein
VIGPCGISVAHLIPDMFPIATDEILTWYGNYDFHFVINGKVDDHIESSTCSHTHLCRRCCAFTFVLGLLSVCNRIVSILVKVYNKSIDKKVQLCEVVLHNSYFLLPYFWHRSINTPFTIFIGRNKYLDRIEYNRVSNIPIRVLIQNDVDTHLEDIIRKSYFRQKQFDSIMVHHLIFYFPRRSGSNRPGSGLTSTFAASV